MPPHRPIRIVSVPLAVAAMACTPFKVDLTGDSGPMPGRPEADVVARCDPSTPFGRRTFVSGLTTIRAKWAGGLRLSADYRTAYFFANGAGGLGSLDLYLSQRDSEASPFGEVLPLAGDAINTPSDEQDPTVAGDGLTLIFARRAAGEPAHIHYATRASPSLSSFTYVGQLVELSGPTASDTAPFLREDGRVLYFGSDRGDGMGSQIYKAVSSGSSFGAAVPVPELGTNVPSGCPVVTPDDGTIYFSRRAPVNDAGAIAQLWTATRTSTSVPFSGLRPVSGLNWAGEDICPTFVTRDRCTLYFFIATFGELDPGGTMTLYVATKPRP